MITIKQIITNLQNSPKPALAGSIYLPTHPQSNGPNMTADQTRFKNALQYIRAHADYDDALLGETMHTLDALYDDMDFWKHQSRSLAVLFSADTLECIKLPVEVTEATYLCSGFVLSPLYIIDGIGADFYVLDVNMTAPRLMHSADGMLEVVNQEGMPGPYKDEVGKDDYQKQLQHQSGGVAAFHGHGEEDTVDEEVKRYLKLIATAVDSFLADADSPLLLAGTVERTAALRKELQYGHVVEKSHDGSVEKLTMHDISLLAQTIMQTRLSAQLAAAAERLHAAAPEFVAVGASEITDVATQSAGRIESLYLPIYRVTADSVQSGDGSSFVIELPKDIAATESLVSVVTEQGGSVIPVQIDTYDYLDQPKALCRF